MFAFGQSPRDYGFDSDWLYSLTYNSFVFADIAIAIVVGIFVFSSKSFMTVVDRYNRPAKARGGTGRSRARPAGGTCGRAAGNGGQRHCRSARRRKARPAENAEKRITSL